MNVNYRELEIYSLAHKLVLYTYSFLERFPDYEDNNLTSQLRRAITCLPLNIAEGSGAGSPKIFLNYLVYCYRSCLESEAALNLARDLHYVTKNDYDEYHGRLSLFIRKLYRYMQFLESLAGDRKRDKSYFYKHNKFQIDKDVRNREKISNFC